MAFGYGSTEEVWQAVKTQPDTLRLTYEWDGRETTREVVGGSLLSGRDEGIRLHIPHTKVSQFHLLFEWDAKTRKWKAKDLYSSNKSWLNNAKMKANQARVLSSGDSVSLADVVDITVEVVPYDTSKVTVMDALRRDCYVRRDTAVGDIEQAHCRMSKATDAYDDWQDALQEATPLINACLEAS